MNESIASRLSRSVLSTSFALLVGFAPSVAHAVCGDGIPERIEQCDDGNLENGDCCDSNCMFEQVESPCTDGNQCTFDFCDGQGTCSSFPNQGAECDDGNGCTVGDVCNSDGFCSSQGSLEDGSTCFQNDLCGGTGQCFFGTCFGDPADCTGFGGVCNSAVCDPQQARCIVTQLDDDTPCDNPSNCTEPGVCKSGECQQPPTDCSGLKDDCNDAFCDVEFGGCRAIPKENGTVCNDASACTDPGTCDAGECLTTPTDCSSFGDQCNFGDCNPETGCFASPLEDGSGCSDDDLCTTGDQCTAGQCNGTPVDCSGAGDACNVGFCDTQTGQCDTMPAAGSPSCDDGDACTTNDTCLRGLCIGEPVDCSIGDTACTVGVCNPDTGQCDAVPSNEGLGCDDGDKCTSSDKCTAGECGGTPLDCSDSGNACNTGFCNGDTGGCETQPLSGPSCNDGNPCTLTDTCVRGDCVGTPKDCSGSDGNCLVGTCDTETGACFGEAAGDGTSCNDGSLCTTGDQCSGGECFGTPKDCSASGGNCIIGTCNPDTGQCVGDPAENGSTCNDGNLCTTSDVCTDGVCGGSAVTCPPSTQQCQESFCNASNGQCANRPLGNGTTCNDGNLCTTSDQCTSGACGGTATDCSNLTNACNVGSCNAQTGGCIAEPRTDGTTCNDGAACTTGDQCTGGVCGGTAVDCSNLTNACNVGTCSTQNGSCVAVPRTDGTTCNDGAACTTGDQCTGGVCGGTAVDCSNLTNACNVGTCSTQNGSCVAVPRTDGTTCNDGAACTAGDECTGGVCGGTAVDCSNLDAPCRTGVCNSQTGQCEAINAANNTPCDDGAFCTATDTCTGGVCVGTGDPCPGSLVCNGQCNEIIDSCNAPSGTPCESDGNPCTDDVCNGTGGCVAEASSENTCDDGLFCTSGDHCADGLCTGEPTCPQTHACGDTCDEVDDACRTCGHPFSNSRCIVNAIFVLQGALGLRECELCTCDVDSSGDVMATDALLILRTCTNLPSTIDCPTGGPTTTTTASTTTTIDGGCLAELDGAIFHEKYTCAQAFTDGEPFCTDQAVENTIQFTYMGSGGFYEVRDVPDTGFVMTGGYDCQSFTWSAVSPGEYSEGGFWDFSPDATTFSGSSAYVADDQSYAGACNETGAESPAIPPDPEPVDPCP